MKLTKTLAIAITTIVLVGRGFANPPAAPANPSNADHNMAEAAKKIAEAMKHDMHQDAEGQRHLDEAWNQLMKALGMDPRTNPDPYTYEGSNADQRQDQKILTQLNKFLVEHHQPTVSSIE